MKPDKTLFHLTNLMANHLAAKQAFCELIQELCPTSREQIAAIDRALELENNFLSSLSIKTVLTETALYLETIERQEDDENEAITKKNEFLQN